MEKNIAQAFAELSHFGRDIQEISYTDFWNVLRENEDAQVQNIQCTDFPCEYTYFSIDGWDYYCYDYLITYYDGYDSSLYVCKVKRATIQEIKDIVSWISN